jgi:hypothetical protein
VDDGCYLPCDLAVNVSVTAGNVVRDLSSRYSHGASLEEIWVSARRVADNAGVRPGAEVFTQDAQRLGKVGAVVDGHFEVRSNLFQRYWLPVHSVTSATMRHVIVAFYRDQLDRWRRDAAAA